METNFFLDPRVPVRRPEVAAEVARVRFGIDRVRIGVFVVQREEIRVWRARFLDWR